MGRTLLQRCRDTEGDVGRCVRVACSSNGRTAAQLLAEGSAEDATSHSRLELLRLHMDLGGYPFPRPLDRTVHCNHTVCGLAPRAIAAVCGPVDELHLIVLWTPNAPGAEQVYGAALQRFRVEGVRIHPAYPTRAASVVALNDFYETTRAGTSVDDARGKQPFVILFVRLNPATEYGQCHGGASARHMVSCPFTNAFKNAARKNATRWRDEARRREPGVIGGTANLLITHATDSVQETKDNLRALQISCVPTA